MSVSMTVPQWKRGECLVDGQAVHLSPLEAELVALFLVAGPGRSLGLDEMYDVQWPGPDGPPLEANRCTRVRLCGLRGKGIPVSNFSRLGWALHPSAFVEPEATRLAA